ncbi:MAG: FAD:protein FMN transferase [bacterium]|nr:FAD:protein FMN transferase [bacterium]
MAGPCEILIDTDDRATAEAVARKAADEAWRVERKFSRYRDDSVVHRINQCPPEGVEVDEETGRLLDFAQRLWEMSEGKFDVTSGVLRRAWTFDGSDRLPAPETLHDALRHVGWDRVNWTGRSIRLDPGMEIDLGGIGKEFAVDRAAASIEAAHPGAGALVNFGGDLMCIGKRRDEAPWRVGVEALAEAAGDAGQRIDLSGGAIATSGDAHRFLLKDDVRYSHILDPSTGWPVPDAPRAVTVAAGSCVQAGMIATLAMLQGSAAKAFLRQQGVPFWVADG